MLGAGGGDARGGARGTGCGRRQGGRHHRVEAEVRRLRDRRRARAESGNRRLSGVHGRTVGGIGCEPAKRYRGDPAAGAFAAPCAHNPPRDPATPVAGGFAALRVDEPPAAETHRTEEPPGEHAVHGRPPVQSPAVRPLQSVFGSPVFGSPVFGSTVFVGPVVRPPSRSQGERNQIIPERGPEIPVSARGNDYVLPAIGADVAHGNRVPARGERRAP